MSPDEVGTKNLAALLRGHRGREAKASHYTQGDCESRCNRNVAMSRDWQAGRDLVAEDGAKPSATAGFHSVFWLSILRLLWRAVTGIGSPPNGMVRRMKGLSWPMSTVEPSRESAAWNLVFPRNCGVRALVGSYEMRLVARRYQDSGYR